MRSSCSNTNAPRKIFRRASSRRAVEALRARWAEVQNAALERAGLDVRVDHRSLEAQGIDREAMRHRGPAVSGIEARGKESEVSGRRAAERAERAQAREPERRAVEAKVRVVTRQEMAAEKVAMGERRALAAEVTGADRAMVLPLIEADRREQLGRAQAAAERRVERRQGIGIGGELKETLLTQARALRERIGQQLAKKGARIKITDCGGRLCIVASKNQTGTFSEWHGLWNDLPCVPHRSEAVAPGQIYGHEINLPDH